MLPLVRHIARLLRACALGFVLQLMLGLQTASANGVVAPVNAAPGVSAGGIAQVVFGLAVVLALVGGAAWLLKRFSGVPGAGSGLIRIIGGASIGQRERIVVVEVAGTWLLVGVAPGQVCTLHTMPKSETAAARDAPSTAPAEANFATWLRRITERRAHG